MIFFNFINNTYSTQTQPLSWW